MKPFTFLSTHAENQSAFGTHRSAIDRRRYVDWQPADRKDCHEEMSFVGSCGHRLTACRRAVANIFLLALFATALPTLMSAAANPSKLPEGMFSTVGNQIVDQNQNPVRLSCVYWPGLNHQDGPLSSLTGPFKGIPANVEAIAATGFNCVRIDFNNISLHDRGTSAFLSQMDQVVGAATRIKLRVIIADHDNEGNYGSNVNYTDDCAAQQSNGIWYDLGGGSDGTDGCKDPGHTTQATYQGDWVAIASRYARNNTVIGYDLWNEPVARKGGSLWGGGSNRDIHRMYETVGSAILSRDAAKLIFAECPLGVYTPTMLYDGTTHGSAPWGDCTGVKALPVVFTVNGHSIKNKVVYDVHLYPNSIGDISRLFGSSSSPGAIKAMNYSFGFFESQNIAPVWDGEGGTGFRENPDDLEWARMLDKYLNGQLGSQGGPTFSGNQQGMGIAWMSWTKPFSGPGSDNLGILNADGSRSSAQLRIVEPLLFYPKGENKGSHHDGSPKH
jgi:aryl-phospho-beta-D-glucosidase BglC (GH1 family)